MSDCDVLIAGSGAAGLTCAIRARQQGLRVLLVEKESHFGGTTARSGGWLWVPGNSHARAEGIADSPDAARQYLEAELGEGFRPQLIDAYLDKAPEMVDFLERETAVRFTLGAAFADYHSDRPGALAGGRSLRALPFDVRSLGTLAQQLSPPFEENTFHGMMIDFGAELKHFYGASRSLKSAAYVLHRLAEYAWQRLRYGAGMRRTTGNALAAMLLTSAARAGVQMRTGTAVTSLIVEDGRVVGAKLSAPDLQEVRPRLATVLACGGFSHDARRQKLLYPHVAKGSRHLSLAASGSTGDGLVLGAGAGGRVLTQLPNAAAWAPVSSVPLPGNRTGRFPHFFDRAKPGVIAVDPSGHRFVNEASSYHDFVQGMFRACDGQAQVFAYVICDRAALRKYGLGFVKPFPVPIGPYLRSGYLIGAPDVRSLASRIGVPVQTLEQTVQTFNSHAVRGDDPEFGKGGTAYNRYLGDAEIRPNPCVRPLRGKLYAVKVVPGDIGTFAGLETDASARVLDPRGRPVAGLYAIGNDMASVMAGHYPGAGITLGPAMTFGYIAADCISAKRGVL
jgi:succinate dehydrogenase/fumarate reductase flavoprotein subunit